MDIDLMLWPLRMRLQEQIRQRDLAEREYLRSLHWTDGELAAFDKRVTGIHARADRVLGLELCAHGVTYQACRRGCPPWRFVPPTTGDAGK